MFRTSWSQDGEDIFLEDYFPDTGFFVDVGAHHPLRFSVTHKLSQRGWTGINVDSNSAVVDLFPKLRPRDVNHFGLVGRTGQKSFYRFEEGALSTLNPELARQRVQEGWKLDSIEMVSVEPLSDILAHYKVPKRIDLLSVDAEGSDFEVLGSMDWSIYEVSHVLVETGEPASHVEDSPIGQLLKAKGYRPHAVFFRSAFFSRVE